MNTLVTSLLFCTLLGISTAYFVDNPTRYSGYEEDETSGLAEAFRRSAGKKDYNNPNLCTPWKKPCTHNARLRSKYQFLRCCGNGTCKCTFWGNNCRCAPRIFTD